MEREKISPQEIAKLKEAAEKERSIHRKIMEDIKKISSVHIGSDYFPEGLPPSTQMEIISRGNKTELEALLEAYANLRLPSYDKERFERANLCEEAQLAVYRMGMGYDDIRNYFLSRNRLCLAVEKEIIDKGITNSRRFSPEGEKYLIGSVLKITHEKDCVDNLSVLEAYINEAKLSEPAEEAFVTGFLAPLNARDIVIDACGNLVKSYIVKYRNLCDAAEVALIAGGTHELIMEYILFSLNGLHSRDAVEKLLRRADREEVTAYYKRYAAL